MRRLLCAIVFLAAAAAQAQQRSIFEPDDSVDPRQHGPAFISRLVVGGAANFVNDYRPLHQNVGFLHIANSVYWRQFQFDYKHSETRAEDGNAPLQVCGCSPPIYFPTPPPPDAIPLAPPPGPKDTLQFGWYRPSGGGPAEPPIMLRARLTLSLARFNHAVESATTGQRVGDLSGREQSIGLDTDTHFSIAGRDVWGSLSVAHTTQSGTADDRKQTAFVYINRFAGRAVGQVLLHAKVGVGGVTNRGGTALNVVNPVIEAFWHDHRTGANVHLIWSGLGANSGAAGWEVNHQIAFFIDRALFVKIWQ